MQILGISRSERFSPNSAHKDAVIFERVARALRIRGNEVRSLCEEEFLQQRPDAQYVFGMPRDEAVLAVLRQMEYRGSIVVNSAIGIDRCIRYPMSAYFMEHGIPYPKSWLVRLRRTGSENAPELHVDAPDLMNVAFPCWVKRGDACAQIKDDICFVESNEQLMQTLRDFCRRGIGSAVVNEHLAGDLVKFYSVAHTDFFYWYYPSPTQGKFGLEAINGESVGFAFDPHAIKRCGDRAARLLDVPVYGGDCVVAADGSFKIIDFNDWPSFSACCDEAGEAIAECIIQKFSNNKCYE